MPIEQLNQPLTFYAFYSASKQGVAGLTVTVDVYRVNTSATATQVVTAGSATGVGGGLYLYQLAGGSVTVEGEYLCVFKTSSTSVDQQHIPAIWVVQKAGVEYLDAAITSRPSATDYTTARAANLDNLDAAVTTRSTLTAANVWDYATASATTAGSLGKLLGDNLNAQVSSRSTLTAANVWDYLTASATTSGSLGKLLGDNLNATVSSRSTLTAANVWDAATSGLTTAGSIGLQLATNVDATISSRGTSTLTAANVWDYLTASATTAGSLGKRIADNLDATVSSRGTGTSTLTAAQVWDYTIPTTPAASSYGERIKTNLDATVSSRTDTATWTATKAGYLDVAISSRLATAGYTAPPTTANIWDYLTASATTVGSIGKRIADNLDAQVSTRLATSGYTAPDNAGIANIYARTDVATSTRASATDYTSARAAKIDNLDAAISTRSTLTAAGVWDYATASATTAGSLGKRIADNVDATVSSRTDSATWTSTKAGYLDVAISSRLATAGYTAPDNTTITNIYARTDVATSTRSTLTAAGVWDYAVPATPVASSYGDRVKTNLDATVSSRTDSTVWTNTKAGYLDVAVSSRLSSAGYTAPDNTSITTILGRVDVATSTRATNAGVWDYATSAATTAGSLGKLMVDNVDATVSSRLATSGYTAPDNATISNIYARTDVATSTRSTLTAANVWDYAIPVTPVASSYGERVNTNLDATVSSRTDAATWTSTKAGYLDVAVSSRLATAGYTAPDNAGITTLTGRLTATRAGYLDNLTNLDATVSSRATVTGTWDALTSGLTTVGSVGKRIADYVDAAVTSRASAADYTTARAAKIDYLDATISSRTDSAVWTNTKAGYIDAAVTSRATTAGVWDYATASISTAGSIGKLLTDNIDASVSSRLAAATYTAPDNTTISNIYARTDVATSTRLAPAGITSLSADVTTILGRVDVAVSTRADAAEWTPTRAARIDATISSRSTLTAPNVWDYAAASAITAGSLGKLIADNLDATISSRTDSSVWTNTKAGYLDATVSSRSTLTAAGVWDAATSGLTTAGSVGKLVVDNLNAPVTGTLTAAQVWDYATASATTAGSIGKRIGDNLDAQVSSRMASGSVTISTGSIQVSSYASGQDPATLVWDALTAGMTTTGSIGKRLSDYVDAAVSTRLATAGYTAPDNTSIGTILSRTDVATSTRADAADWTAARAGKIDYLDAAVTSRLAPAGITALSADVTSIKSVVDTNLNATVGSRLAASSYVLPDNATIASIYGRTDVATSTRAAASDYTSARAAKLDYLDAAISSIDDAVTVAGYASGQDPATLVWSAMTAGLTTVGTIGKRISDNLDATITSRLAPADITSMQADITAIKVPVVANVDATISSRLAAAAYTAPDNSTIASIYGRTDVATSTRADGAQWTTTRAGYIDFLDATISSRLTPAGITSLSADVTSIKGTVDTNLNATITSRAAAADYTSARAVLLDNLDATISSRLAPAGITTLSADVSAIKTPVLAYVDATISSRATASALSSLQGDVTAAKGVIDSTLDTTVSSRAAAADWTPTRAAKIDYLDASVSSRATVSGTWAELTSNLTIAGSIGKRLVDNVDVTVSSRADGADYTSARAVLIDNLDATISSRSTVATVWDAATSGMVTAGSIGKRISDNLDATITSRPAATDYTSARAIKLDYLDAPVSSLLAPGGITSLAADVSSIKTVVDANMDATISSRATVSGTWDALTSGMVTVGSVGKLLVDRIDDAITSRLAAGSAVAIVTGSIEVNTYAPGQDPATLVWNTLLANIQTNSSIGKLLKDRVPYLDATVSSRLSAGVGSSTYSVTVTTDDGVTPISGASVWVTTDIAGVNVIAGTLTTNGAGVATFLLDPASYYLWRQAEGWSFQNPVAITVT